MEEDKKKVTERRNTLLHPRKKTTKTTNKKSAKKTSKRTTIKKTPTNGRIEKEAEWMFESSESESLSPTPSPLPPPFDYQNALPPRQRYSPPHQSPRLSPVPHHSSHYSSSIHSTSHSSHRASIQQQLYRTPTHSSSQSLTPHQSQPLHSSIEPHRHHPSSPVRTNRQLSPPSPSVPSQHPAPRAPQSFASGPLVKPPRYVELVEGLGVSLPAHELLGAERDSRTASSLTRRLMTLLFSNEEMAMSSVRGKTKPPLDKQKMEAILGFAISKYPGTTSEYLIRQANDKLHTERKKYAAKYGRE